MKIETNNGTLTIEFKENVKNEVLEFVTEKVVNKLEKLDECKTITSTNPNKFNTGVIKITMSTIDRPDIDQIADIDNDIPGYDRIRVFDTMDRKCNITVINDGYKSLDENDVIEKDADAIHFIINRNGIDHEDEQWSQAEITLYPGEAWKFYNVHELRIRSETQGTRYRITEDDIIATSTIRSVL